MGPPSSGGIAVLQMLGQLERFDLSALGPDSAEFWHLFLESQRIAYADRELYLADSDFVAVPVDGMIDPAYLAQRGALIDPAAKLETVDPGTPSGAPLAMAKGDRTEENGTSHFSVVDAEGNAISYTSTIEGAFGSGLFYRGFYLNNELTDFSASPEVDGKPVANRVEAGKRPRSSMAPTIVFGPDGAPMLIIGAAGGPTIPVQTARSIIGVVDFGLTASEALALPLIMNFGQPRSLKRARRWKRWRPNCRLWVTARCDRSPLRSRPMPCCARRLAGKWPPIRGSNPCSQPRQSKGQRCTLKLAAPAGEP